MITLEEAIDLYDSDEILLRSYEDKADHSIKEAARRRKGVAFVNGAPPDICCILCKRYAAEGYLTKWYWDYKASTFVVEIWGWAETPWINRDA